MRAVSLALGFVALNACRCDTNPVITTECNFTVEPTEIDFNPTEVGASSEKSWHLTNIGKGVSLSALQTTFESVNGEHYSTEIPDGTNIAPGDDATFVVTFHPTAQAILPSSFIVSHADVGPAKCPTVTVTLRGTGIEPQEVDAGFPDAGPDDGGFADAGPVVDAGSVDTPDAGVILPPNGEWFAYGAFEDARARFAAVALKDGTGEILAVGGFGEDGVALDSLERFDPATGVSRIVGHMAVPRAEPAAALLPDGKVMIMGGRSAGVDGFALRTVEVYDPVANAVSCADTAGCGLDKQDQAALPVGRIGAIAASTSTGVMLLLGRTLDTANNNAEIGVAGGDFITVSPTLTRAAIGNEALLGAREGVASVVDTDGSVLLVGGTSLDPGTLGDVLDEVILVDGPTHSAGSAGSLPVTTGPRSFASAAKLSSGDVIVAGGFNGNGNGLDSVVRVAGAFAPGAAIADVDLQLTPRVGGSLVALSGDILVWAGGMTRRTSGLDPTDSELPQTSADILVPFGTNNFLRLSSDNELAQGRFEHQALTTSSSGPGGATQDIALFLGGVNTSPRRTPHPHAERYLLSDNRFLTYGLMGAGTAIEAGVIPSSGPSAALLSAGGVDPHTGRTSSAVRAFDALTGVYVEDGALREPRRDHTLTRLAANPANVLLVAGGRDENGTALSSLSLFDSVSQVDRPLPVSLRTARSNHTATLLADDGPLGPGAVLICGGQGQGGEALDSCEIFIPPENTLDPNTFDTARVIPVSGRLSTGRVAHTATLLDSGEVLVVGGGDVTVDLVRADLFEPDATDPFVRPTGQPNEARRGHASVFIGSGRVLVVGGDTFNSFVGPTRSAELYVRASEAWLPLPDMEDEREAPGAFLLGDGNVLIAGGTRNNAGTDPEVPTRSNKTSELYVVGSDGTGTFEELPLVPLSFARSDVRFIDVFGRAIVTGGDHRDGIVTTGDERRTPITFVDFLEDPTAPVGH